MTIRMQLQDLVSKMLEGKILLPEALAEFEKLYIERALSMTDNHLLKTAAVLGIHRNTLSKKLSNEGGKSNRKSKKESAPSTKSVRKTKLNIKTKTRSAK